MQGFIETCAIMNLSESIKGKKNRDCTNITSFKVNIWSELLYSPAQPEPSETSFLSFL